MKQGVMLLLILAGLTEMGVLQATGDITAEQARSAVCPGCYEPGVNNKEVLASGTFHVEGSYGNPGALFPSIASNQQSTYIKKTLKGYRSMKRTSYQNTLMQLV